MSKCKVGQSLMYIYILSTTTIKALFLYYIFVVMLASISYPSTTPDVSPVYSRIRLVSSLVFNVVFSISLFILLSFFVWPWYCLSFFDLRLHNVFHIHLLLYYHFLLINHVCLWMIVILMVLTIHVDDFYQNCVCFCMSRIV